MIKLRMNSDNESSGSDNAEEKSDDYDVEDVVLDEDADTPQANGTQNKVAAAVEKGMDDDQLVPYFNRYILISREQRLQKKTFTEEQLHDFIAELFDTLEYKNDESEGKLTSDSIHLKLFYLRSINFFGLSNLLRRKSTNGHYESNPSISYN
jgi:hypothetical protein